MGFSQETNTLKVPRYSRILSHSNHAMPNTEGIWHQQAGESMAKARGILETTIDPPEALPLQDAPRLALLSSGLYL